MTTKKRLFSKGQVVKVKDTSPLVDGFVGVTNLVDIGELGRGERYATSMGRGGKRVPGLVTVIISLATGGSFHFREDQLEEAPPGTVFLPVQDQDAYRSLSIALGDDYKTAAEALDALQAVYNYLYESSAGEQSDLHALNTAIEAV